VPDNARFMSIQSMQNIPLVTIIIPVYNGARYLSAAIDSALQQSYQRIEVLVVNDGSTDNGDSEKVILGYGDKVRYFKKPNGGVSSALNMGVREMEGEYMSWLCQDDVYSPDKIEKQIEQVLSAAGNKVIPFCSTRTINAKGEIISRPQIKVYRTGFEAIEFITKNSPFLSTMLISKELLSQVGRFNEKMGTTGDWDLAHRLLLYAKLIPTFGPVVYTRAHNQSAGATRRTKHYKEVAETYFAALSRVSQSSLDEYYPDTSVNSYLQLSHQLVRSNNRMNNYLVKKIIAHYCSLQDMNFSDIMMMGKILCHLTTNAVVNDLKCLKRKFYIVKESI